MSVYSFFLLLALSFLLGNTGRQLATNRLEYGLATGFDENRLLLAGAAWSVFAAYPLFGSGLNTWHLTASRYIPRELAGWELDYAHNEYLQLFAEMGVGGVVLAVFFFFFLIRSFNEAWKGIPLPTDRVELAGFFCAVLLPLLHALVDFPFHLPATLIVSALVLAMYVRLVERHRRESVQRDS